MELHTLLELMAGGVGACDLERRGGNVGGVDFSVRKFLGQGQRDAARASAHIENAEVVGRALYTASPLRPIEFEDGFDDVLCLRAWNEHRRSDDEVHTPEFLMPGDVLRGHSPRAFDKGGLVLSLLVGGKFALGMCEQVGAVTVENEH